MPCASFPGRSLAVALTLVPLLGAPSLASPLEGRLATHGFDAITVPGQPAELRLKVERSGWRFWRPDVKDTPVRFTATGSTLSARTDRDGVAHASLPGSLAVGVYSYVAEPEGRSDAAASSRVWVLDPARPLAVVDIDGTLSTLPSWLVPFRGHKAKAYADSPQLLNELARTHQIVYLTARDDNLDAKTRAFLALRGFPAGPVIFNDLGLTTKAERAQLNSKNHGVSKLQALRKLQALGLTVGLGIGNAATDAYAYENAGAPSYIRSDPQAGASIRFATYAELRLRLIADGILPGGSGLAGALPPP